jgi:opacity protein-like surface antigen
MKKLSLLIAFTIAAHFLYSQNHSVGLSYGHVYNGALRTFVPMDCGPTYVYNNGIQYNVNYRYKFSNKIALVSSLQYQHNEVESRSTSPAGETQSYAFDVNNLNIPILANLSFWKYFFVEGGPLLNFEIDSYGPNSQTGLGFSLGAGAQYDLGKLNFFLKSQNQIQTLIPFNWDGRQDKLITNSLSIGIFYQL